MSKNASTTARPRAGRIRTLVSALLGAVLAVGGVLVAPTGAVAAPGDLVIGVEFIDGVTDEPIEDLQAAAADRSDSAEWYYKLNVTYSCGPVDCPAAVVRIASQPTDPFYDTYRFATYNGTSLPGNVVSSSAANGETVQLGDLAPGTSGSFQMTYRYQGRGVGADTASFFPQGHTIPTSVELSATGLDPVTATDQVTWHIDTPEPRVLANSPDLARTGNDFTYTLYMSASCQWERSTAGHGEPAYECAREYTVTDTLEPGAIFVSASHGGVYDEATNSVSWTVSGPSAAIGWGPLNRLGDPRTVTVNYPDSIIDGDSCVIDVTNTLDVEMTYLSGTTKSASATRTHQLNACEPFASAVLDYKTSTRDAGSSAEPLVWERANNYWSVRVANRANVPGVATIVDEDLDQAGLPVYAVRLVNTRGTIEYTLDDGTTGTVTDVTGYDAPAGRSIAAATVVTAPLNGPNLEESNQTQRTQIDVRYHYTVGENVPDEGWVRTNTASATMSYPDTDLADLDLGDASYTVTAVPRPAYFRPTISAQVAGGGQPVIGTPVTYSLNASTADVEPGTPFEGQFVYVAPVGWEILPDSAAVAGQTDFTFEYKTVTLAGEERQAVYAHRPAGTLWGANETWPTMTVQATPTSAVAGGSVGNAAFYMGDAGHNFGANTAIWGNNGNFRFVDAPDFDGDGEVTESFAFVTTNVTVGATTALNVLKEICYADESQPDGCEWRSDPDVPVAVAPNTTDIEYRVTITNNGSTAQTGVVAYDVLPHVGDTGLTANTASVERGSTFDETLATAEAGTGVSLTFSDSTNPCRPEVFAGGPAGCSDSWNADAEGAVSIRAAVTGTLAAGQSRSFTYTAAVVGDPVNGDIACNSVAIDSATTAANEPRPVCAQIVEADLAVDAPNRLPLQVDRPGVVPFTVTNLGGAPSAPAEVTIDVPAELTVSALEFDGWLCTSEDGPAPIEGGTTLSCAPTDGSITMGEPLALNLPVTPAAAADGEVCVDADVAGDYYDGVPGNNETQACFEVVAGEPELSLTKDDELDSVQIGDEYTYTITVDNRLVGESLTDATVIDELPATLAFVSASGGGEITGQAADGSGGTITWALGELAPASTPNEDGASGDPATGSSTEVSVTVRVLQSAENVSEITNAATVTATDPGFGGQLAATDDDIDAVDRTAALSLAKTVTPTTVPAAGAEVEYSFVVTNEGDVTVTDIAIVEETFTGTGVDFPVVDCPAEPLAPGAELTCTAGYTVTQDDVEAGSVSNSATATAVAPEGVTNPESDLDTAVLTIPAAAGIELVKSVGSETVTAAGDTVTYLFTVTNTGNRIVTDLEIDETAFTGTGAPVVAVCPDEPIAPGDAVTCEAEYEVTQADVNSGRIDNTAVATGTAAGAEIASAASSAAVVIGASPALTLVKSASSGDLVADQDVTYSFVVTNTGNVTLEDVVIDETAFTGSGELSDVVCADGADAIDPGEQVICSADYTITQADVDAGAVDNTATATATASGGPITSSPSSVHLPFDQTPGLALVKSADVDEYTQADQALEYRFLVTNTGNVTMSDVLVEEVEFSGTGELGDLTCDAATLLPGQQMLCTAPYTTTLADVDAGELTNIATASAQAPGADERTITAPSEVITPFAGAITLALTKDGSPIDVDGDRRVTAADRIQWTFTVTNTGAATLLDVAIADPMAGEIVCDVTELAPGDVTTCAATEEYQITDAQARDGRVVNVASASAFGVGGAAVSSAEAQAVVEVGVIAPPATEDPLATTGADSRAALLIGALTLLFGGALVLISRGRRKAAA